MYYVLLFLCVCIKSGALTEVVIIINNHSFTFLFFNFRLIMYIHVRYFITYILFVILYGNIYAYYITNFEYELSIIPHTNLHIFTYVNNENISIYLFKFYNYINLHTYIYVYVANNNNYLHICYKIHHIYIVKVPLTQYKLALF